jgi:hypothetical protein
LRKGAGPCGVAFRVACSVAPAAKSPLKERLAGASTGEVETSVRTCLKQGGWKVDDVGSYAGGANVVSGTKTKDRTDVFIYGADQHPRITGGPPEEGPFWKCLTGQLAGASGEKGDEKSKDETENAKGANEPK